MSAPVQDGPTSSDAEGEHPLVTPKAIWEPAQLKKLQMNTLKVLLRNRKCVTLAFDKVVFCELLTSPPNRRLWKATMKVADAAACLADALVEKPLTDEEKRIDIVWRKLELPEPSSLDAEEYNELDAAMFACVFSGTDDVERYLKSRDPLGDETESGPGDSGGLSAKALTTCVLTRSSLRRRRLSTGDSLSFGW